MIFAALSKKSPETSSLEMLGESNKEFSQTEASHSVCLSLYLFHLFSSGDHSLGWSQENTTCASTQKQLKHVNGILSDYLPKPEKIFHCEWKALYVE